MLQHSQPRFIFDESMHLEAINGGLICSSIASYLSTCDSAICDSLPYPCGTVVLTPVPEIVSDELGSVPKGQGIPEVNAG